MAQKVSPEVQNVGKYLKRKMVYARLMGLGFCLLCAGALALLALQMTDHNTTILLICFCMAGLFMSNGNLQSVKNGRKMYVVNMLLACLFFLAVIAFTVLSFTSGQMTF